MTTTMVMVETFKQTVHPEVEGPEIALREELGIKSVARTQIFPVMTKEEESVYKVICPKQCSLEEYPKRIPFEVLEAIKEAKAAGFCSFTVWDQELCEVKDPIVTCRSSDKYPYTVHMVARWGAELAPLAQLKAQAIVIYKRELEAHLQQIVAQCKAGIERIKSLPHGYLPNDSSMPYFSFHF